MFILQLENNNIIKPSQITIQSIFPNPTNTSFTISFSISDTNEPTEIIINDILGRKIYTTPIHNYNNQFKWTWNGLNNNGAAAPTGTYFVSISQKNQIETRKITILK